MKLVKYLLEYILIIILFILFKLLGYRVASNLGYFLGKTFGPFFRSKKIINDNLTKFDSTLTPEKLNNISEEMWGNYGRILSEYPYISNFRKGDLDKYIKIENIERLEEVKKGQPVVFVSAHFSNFELMAMAIEKAGINLSAIYRPLNNKMVNSIMEPLRKKYICKKQIKKGISGTKQLLEEYKKGSSIALMIDQRVSEGIECDFFGYNALTTTIPAQFIKKFNLSVIPIYIERLHDEKFKLEISKSIQFSKENSLEEITSELNRILEQMIIRNPDQWIWTHNRWKI